MNLGRHPSQMSAVTAGGCRHDPTARRRKERSERESPPSPPHPPPSPDVCMVAVTGNKRQSITPCDVIMHLSSCPHLGRCAQCCQRNLIIFYSFKRCRHHLIRSLTSSAAAAGEGGGGGGGRRERERERERETDRQTDRQTDRHTERGEGERERHFNILVVYRCRR